MNFVNNTSFFFLSDHTETSVNLIHLSQYSKTLNVSLPILQWSHFCFVRDLTILKWKIFINGEQIAYVNSNDGKLEGGGVLILGKFSFV